jgi:hypothetical protein
MRIRIPLLVTVCLGMFLGVITVVAQPLRLPEPIIVQIAEIDRGNVRVRAEAQRDSTDLTPPLARQGARLSFQFLHRSREEVNALAEDGVRTKRDVRILDGSRLVAEGRVAGTATFQKDASEARHGFILLFDCLTEAERAASAMGEDIERTIDRMLTPQ